MLWVLEFVETDLEDQHLQIKIFYIYKLLPSCFHSGCLPSSHLWISVSSSSVKQWRMQGVSGVPLLCHAPCTFSFTPRCHVPGGSEVMPFPCAQLFLLRPLSWSWLQAAQVVSSSSCPAKSLSAAVGGHSDTGRKPNATQSGNTCRDHVTDSGWVLVETLITKI